MTTRPSKLGWPLIGRYICHNCMGGFVDGKIDCRVVDCPLYEKMPYRKLEPTYSFMAINPKRQGFVDWSGNAVDPRQRTTIVVNTTPDNAPESADDQNESWDTGECDMWDTDDNDVAAVADNTEPLTW